MINELRQHYEKGVEDGFVFFDKKKIQPFPKFYTTTMSKDELEGILFPMEIKLKDFLGEVIGASYDFEGFFNAWMRNKQVDMYRERVTGGYSFYLGVNIGQSFVYIPKDDMLGLIDHPMIQPYPVYKNIDLDDYDPGSGLPGQLPLFP